MVERSDMLRMKSIGKLLLRLSIPATIGMIVQALYNLVDTIFVGQGVGLLDRQVSCVSIQMIIMSFTQMFGIGGASLISRN